MSSPSTSKEAGATVFTYELTVLGGFALSVNGRTLKTVTAPRLQSLLAYLCLNAHKQLDRSDLASMFWPDVTEEQARGHLRKALYKLKECLPSGDEPLEFSKSSIEWRASCSCDVLELEALLEGPSTQEQLRRILNRYVGELLPGCTDLWCLQRRESLRARAFNALDELCQQLETRRQYGDAAELIQARLSLDPVHEESWFRLFRIRWALGDRSAAQRAYTECKAILARELDVEPSQAFEQAVQQLSRSHTRAEPVVVRLPLVGRVHEWSELISAWRHSSREGMRCVLIQGVAGIGKTRLAEEMAQYVQQQGHRVGAGTCSQSDQSGAFSILAMLLKALPVSSSVPLVLAEVARLVPELYEAYPHLPEVRSLNEPGQRQHFFQVLARYLLDQEPLLLWVDDIQWCDDATLEFMQYLFRTFPQRKVLWLLTLRMDDAPSRGQLPQDLLPSLRRQKVLCELSLGPLTHKESTTLLLAEAGETLSPHLLDALYAEAEGTPLYLLELLRARHLQAQTAVMAGQYPHTLTEAVAVRCSVLRPIGRLCLDALAAVEGPASVELLAQVCERSELEILQELEDLLRRRLVEERPDASVQFAHGLIGSIVYRLISLPKRRILHRRIAEALCTAPEALRELALQIARQLEKAQLQEKAGPYLMAAGRRATQFAEHQAARQHFEKALSQTSLSEQERLLALQELSQTTLMLGAFDDALTVLEQLITYSKKREDQRAYASALIHQAHVLVRLNEHDKADRSLTEALRVMPSGEELALFYAQVLHAELSSHRLQFETVWSACEHVYEGYQRLSQHNSDPAVRIAACIPFVWMGHKRAAQSLSDEAFRLAQEQGRRDWSGMARFWHSIWHLMDSDYDAAEEALEQAIHLAEASECHQHVRSFQRFFGGMRGLQGKFRQAMKSYGFDPDSMEPSSPLHEHSFSDAAYLMAHFGAREQAWSWLLKAQAEAERSNSRKRLLRAYLNLYSVALLYQRLDEAQYYQLKCSELLPFETWRQTASSEGEGLDPWAHRVPGCLTDLRIECLYFDGSLLLKKGEARAAQIYLREASRLRPFAQTQVFTRDPQLALVEALLASKELGEARAVLEVVALETHGKPCTYKGMAYYHGLRWQLAQALGEQKLAEEALHSARRSLLRLSHELGTAEARRRLCEDLPHHASLAQSE